MSRRRRSRLPVTALGCAAAFILVGASLAPAAPIVTTGTATEVTANGATLHGTIDPQGEAVGYQFQYVDGNGRLNDGYFHDTAGEGTLDAGSGPTEVSATIGDLVSGTPYFFRLVAADITGQVHVFGTQPKAPSVAIDDVRSESTTSVYVAGTASTTGIPTDFHYEYGTTASYGLSTPQREHVADPTCSVDPLPSPPAPVPAPYGYMSPLPCWVGEIGGTLASGVELEDLQPGTTYHVRLVAHNAVGTTATADTTFTTDGMAPAAPQPTPPPPRPRLAGAPRVGSTLGCHADGADVFAYAWLRDGARIHHASGRRYVLQPIDTGHEIACRIDVFVDYVETFLTSDGLRVTAPTEPTLLTRQAAVGPTGLTAVRLACRDRSASCRGQLTLRLRRRARTLELAHADVSVPPGTSARIRLRLAPATLHALDAAADGRVRVEVELGATRNRLTLHR